MTNVTVICEISLSNVMPTFFQSFELIKLKISSAEKDLVVLVDMKATACPLGKSS